VWILDSTTAAQKNMTQNVAAVNGTTLYYEMKGEGFPTVLVSGGGILDRRGWDKEFEQLSRHYNTIRYDVRGIGKSARPTGPFSHGEDLYALLSFLRVPHAHVIGLSAGAAIAIDFAIAHPDMVDHLVLASPGLSNDATAKENLQSLAGLAELVKSQGIEHAIDLTLSTPFVVSTGNRPARKLLRKIYRDNADVFEAGFPLYTLWQPLAPPAQDQLSRIRAKVLILRGDKDDAAYSALTEKISRGIPQAETVVIAGGTHFLHLEKPGEFQRLVNNFLKR
jgi:pimeloyl-ACP methyl ester carboxylesterase